MTVAAVIVATDAEEALADAAGRPAVRRIVEAAWAGGAMPVVVVSPDPDGTVAETLAGSPARLEAPAGTGSVGDMALGARAAGRAVVETDAVLVWPARYTWVDPETVTSLIEGHGAWPDRVIHPLRQGVRGWPVLIPVTLVADPDEPVEMAALPLSPAATAPHLDVELGDPGTVWGRDVPLEALEPYDGPPGPVGGPPPEWGAAAAERTDDLR